MTDKRSAVRKPALFEKIILPLLLPFVLLHELLYGIVVNAWQLTCRIIISPFSLCGYHKAISPLIHVLGLNFVWMLTGMGGCRFRVFSNSSTKELQKQTTAIMISNHCGSLDWLVIAWMMIRLKKVHCLRSIAKASLAVIPVMGWTWYFSDFIFLKRRMADDKRSLERGADRSAISKSNWNRLPAGEHTGLPVVVGIKWQRPEEREQDTSITGPIGPGEQSRTFNVIPKNIEDNSFNPTQFLMQSADLLGRDASPVGVLSLPYSKSPPRESPLIPQSATHPYGGNGSAVKGAFIPGVDPVTPLTAALPVGDGVTARWKRIPDENEVARWVREESVSGSPAPIIPPHAMF
eukprot:TRINITY_DN5644_c0_g1_i6.p1 TRINITY_DN5644_c0_g1~~TRINITY_DN5644_c0_g1_i6.p1  ORF type:complete len:349 (+),score=56.75 TRINITY_DN5644_c0_g1_i6:136-1182(+)